MRNDDCWCAASAVLVSIGSDSYEKAYITAVAKSAIACAGAMIMTASHNEHENEAGLIVFISNICR